MAKNNQEAPKEEAPATQKSKIRAFKRGVFKLLLWLVILAAAVGLWKNPDYIKSGWQWLQSRNQAEEAPEITLEGLAIQLENMQKQLAGLQAAQEHLNRNVDADALNQRMEALEKVNLNVIDSKADIATVFGMVNRLDKMEENLQTLTKFTDESALILTGAMLVKDSAERGNDFVYEAEILRQIAEKNQKVKAPIEVISRYAAEGIRTNQYLINEFESIYAALLKQQKEEFEQSWKDRINSKLNEIVKIKRIKEDAPEFKANQDLEQIRTWVENGEFAKAAALLEKTEAQQITANPQLQNWLRQAKAKVEFEKAIAEISTYSLAMMKVNFIKKETGND